MEFFWGGASARPLQLVVATTRALFWFRGLQVARGALLHKAMNAVGQQVLCTFPQYIVRREKKHIATGKKRTDNGRDSPNALIALVPQVHRAGRGESLPRHRIAERTCHRIAKTKIARIAETKADAAHATVAESKSEAAGVPRSDAGAQLACSVLGQADRLPKPEITKE